MKKVYLIHGWGGSPNSEPWFSWLRGECQKRNIGITVPRMPDTNYPKITEWVSKLNDIIIPVEETYLIGHSMGAQAILRYLEQCPTSVKIKGCVFVAGFFNLLDGHMKIKKRKDYNIILDGIRMGVRRRLKTGGIILNKKKVILISVSQP